MLNYIMWTAHRETSSANNFVILNYIESPIREKMLKILDIVRWSVMLLGHTQGIKINQMMRLSTLRNS